MSRPFVVLDTSQDCKMRWKFNFEKRCQNTYNYFLCSDNSVFISYQIMSVVVILVLIVLNTVKGFGIKSILPYFSHSLDVLYDLP